MVARLFRLRVALAGGFFRGSFAHGARAAILLLAALAAAVVVAFAPVWWIESGAERAAVDVAFGTLVLALILLVPFFDSKRHLEPRQFAIFPLSHTSIAVGMLVTTILSWPFLVFLVWCIALVIARPEWQDTGMFAAAALILAALLAVTSVRLASGFARFALGDRYAGSVRFVGWIIGVALLPVLVFAIASSLQADNTVLADTAAPLGWTPFGAAFAAIVDAHAGDTSTATLRLALVAGAVLVFALLWGAVVRASLQRTERPRDVSSARQGLGWFERFAARPAPAIAARTLTYWMRDPRYRIALIAIPVAPIAVFVAFLVAGADLSLAVALPLPILLLLLGWSLHNDIALDSTAIWEHIASGIRGWADRVGRLAPIIIFGVPLAVVGSSLVIPFMGEWRVLPAYVGLNISVLLVASGVSSLFSALMPYPATRPGDSPFVQPQWSGSGSGSSQTLSMLSAVVLAVPPVWVAISAITEVSFWGNVWALLFGVGYGLVVLALGIATGGKLFDKRGPEILAVTQIFD